MRFLSINSFSTAVEQFSARGLSASLFDKLSIALLVGKTADGAQAPAGIWTDGKLSIQFVPSALPFLVSFNIVPGAPDAVAAVNTDGELYEYEDAEWLDEASDLAENLPDVFDDLAAAYLRKALDDGAVRKSDTMIVTDLIDRLSDHRPVLTATEENALQGAMNGEATAEDMNLIGSAMAKADEFEARKVGVRIDFVKTMARLEGER